MKEYLGQGGIGAAGPLAGLAPQGKLAQHEHNAHQGHQDEVDNQEGKPAGLSHFIGKTPQIAQANG